MSLFYEARHSVSGFRPQAMLPLLLIDKKFHVVVQFTTWVLEHVDIHKLYVQYIVHIITVFYLKQQKACVFFKFYSYSWRRLIKTHRDRLNVLLSEILLNKLKICIVIVSDRI